MDACWAICVGCDSTPREWDSLMNGKFKCRTCGAVRAWALNGEASKPYPRRPDDLYVLGVLDTEEDAEAMRREAALSGHDFEEPFAA